LTTQDLILLGKTDLDFFLYKDSRGAVAELRDRKEWYQKLVYGWIFTYHRSKKDMAVIFTRIVKLAKNLRRCKSYLGCQAVVEALTHPLFEKLDLPIPKDYRNRLEKLEKCFDSSTYALEMKTRSLPIVPWIEHMLEAVDVAEEMEDSVPAPEEAKTDRNWGSAEKVRLLYISKRKGFVRFQRGALIERKWISGENKELCDYLMFGVPLLSLEDAKKAAK
jgi:hypothetical protein